MEPLFAPLDRVYLNAAGRSPLPLPSLAAGLAAAQRKAHSPWDIGDTSADLDTVRALFASLVGASAEDICITPSCSYAMSLAAHNLRHRISAQRRGVLVLADQMSSNVMPWQALCTSAGGELVIVPRPPDHDWTAAVLARLDGVAICALPPCHWCDGALVDLEAIGAECRKRGVALVVDGTQFVGGGGQLDVRRIGAEFVACSIHKWLLGPYGACLCVAAPSFWRDATPLEHHDRNREGAQHVECLPMAAGGGGYPTAFMAGARRLDSGGRPSYLVLPQLRVSLELLTTTLHLPKIIGTLRLRTDAIAARAAALGFDVPPHRSASIIGLRPSAAMPDAAALVASLARRSPPVVVSERFGAIRVSPHVYNTAADVDHLIDGLRDAIAAAGHAPPAAAPPPAADDFAFTPPEISCEEQMRRLAEMRSRL